MGSDVPGPALVSIVVTVKNEEAHLRDLLESLLLQEEPYEVVLVDALSRDSTFAIAQEYAARFPEKFRVFRRYGSRGIGRNAGVHDARADRVVFIDGDCFADSGWLAAVRAGFERADVVAGRTIATGAKRGYAALERVELFRQGSDVTYPSCNLGYRRLLFEGLGGFDPRFITAEDIDLNLRAIAAGAVIRYVPDAVVYHHARPNLLRFLYQAFWNGYGRKQLTEKHGNLWGHYRVRRLVGSQRSVLAWMRITAALGGYATRVLAGRGDRLSRPRRSDGAPRAPMPRARRTSESDADDARASG